MNTVFSALYATIIWPLRDRVSREEGLEAVEYALVAALLSVVIIGAMSILQGNGTSGISGLFSQLATKLGELGGDAAGASL